MKKLTVLLLAVAMCLDMAACGSDTTENEDKTAKKDVYFENDTLKIDMATIKLTNSEIAPADDFSENGYLVIEYEITNDQEDEALSPDIVFMACFTPKQESDSTVDTLSAGILPDKYSEKAFPFDSELKPGATESSVICYELNGSENPVVMYANQGIAGDELGKKVYNLE